MKPGLMAVMALGLCSTGVHAATSGVLTTYTVNDGQAKITDAGSAAGGAMTLPSTLGGYPLWDAGYGAFRTCDALTSVTIPNSVTDIGSSAFHGCSAQTSPPSPSSTKSTGASVFKGCTGMTTVISSSSAYDPQKKRGMRK